jgi:hypothetical protein
VEESVEFRVPEKYAAEHFPEDFGERLGGVPGIIPASVRRIIVNPKDTWYHKIASIHATYREQGKYFFFGWDIRRNYSQRELASAEILLLRIRRVFEPAGEECGTEYDESVACPLCGAGANQLSPLFLKENRLPKRCDIAKTIAGEVIVSERFRALFEKFDLSGALFAPVSLLSSGTSMPTSKWFQLKISNYISVSGASKFGEDPFDDGHYGRCPHKDTLGLCRLSELEVIVDSPWRYDIGSTQQFVGCRRGLLRPERILLIKNELWKILKSSKILGFDIEVVKLGSVRD